MGQLITCTRKDGSVRLEMESGNPADWLMLLEAAADSLQEKLDALDPQELPADDRLIHDYLQATVTRIAEATADFERELLNQETESPCEFYFGKPRPAGCAGNDNGEKK